MEEFDANDKDFNCGCVAEMGPDVGQRLRVFGQGQ